MKQALSAALFLAIAFSAFAEDIVKLPPREKRWALVIGVDNYDDPQLNLNGAARDAKTLRDALVETAGFPAEQVILLATGESSDRLPTRGKILGRLTSLLTKLVPRDGLFLLAFSGHGIEREGRVYLYPSDIEKSDNIGLLQQTAVSVEWIRQQVEENRISQVLFLLDSCRNDPGGRAEIPNRMTEAYVSSFSFDTRNEGVRAFATLFASGVNQRAYEYKQKRQGYFTWAIVEGLRGGAANERGEVTLSSLVKYVEETVPVRVARDLGNDQQPYSKFEGYRAQDLVLSIVPSKKTEVPAPAPQITRDTVDPNAIELKFWESVEKLGTTAAYEEYLRRYPNGIYSNLARMMTAPRPAAYSRAAADQAYDAGQYETARAIFEKGVAARDIDAQAGLGRMLYHCLGGVCDFARARSLLDDAANRGSREADLWLAVMEFLVGDDFAHAVGVARAAAERGEFLGRYALMLAHETGRGIPLNLPEASRLCELAFPGLRQRVEKSDPWAQNWLAYEYSVGRCGLSTDLQKTRELYESAANRGFARATTNLGYTYLNGEGTPKDEHKAVELFRKASNQLHPAAQNALARMYSNGQGGLEKDVAKAIDLYGKAAAQGLSEAMWNLAYLYEVGLGVPKDERKAVDLYRQAIRYGHNNARNTLGRMYARGAGGLTKDLRKAFELYQQSADTGDSWGQLLVGYAYQMGEGVTKDLNEATKWYRLCAAQGEAGGQNNLATMYRLGQGGVEKDLAKAVSLYRQAVDQGASAAQYNLGTMYENGEGVEKDLEKAVALYKLAAAQGDENATKSLARLGR
jgi:TPR repeat protein